MIVGGTVAVGSSKKARKTYLMMVQNVQLTGFILKIPRIDSSIIGFSEEMLDVFTTHMTMRSSLASGRGL